MGLKNRYREMMIIISVDKQYDFVTTYYDLKDLPEVLKQNNSLQINELEEYEFTWHYRSI